MVVSLKNQGVAKFFIASRGMILYCGRGNEFMKLASNFTTNFALFAPGHFATALIVALVVFGAICTASGQAAPRIKVARDSRLGISIKGIGGPQGAEVTRILKNDLDLSGWFAIEDDAPLVVDGSTGGGGLKGRVTDATGTVVLTKVYGGPFRSQVHQFADDIVKTLTNQEGIATSRIAFIGRRTGRKEVYIADYDGSNVQQLTRDGTISVSPALSPDGRFLAYTSYKSGYPDVYLIDLASGARNPIVRSPGTNSGAAFSPDGGRIALTMSKDGNPELYVVGIRGGMARRLTQTRAVESSPGWSPNGAEIVFSSDAGGAPQLFRISSGGGSPIRLNTGYGYCTEPSWSPDGTKIAFNVRAGGMQIAEMNLAGGGVRLLGPGEDPAWGANSRHLVYSTGNAIVLHDTFTGRKTPIITNAGRVSEPSWSR